MQGKITAGRLNVRSAPMQGNNIVGMLSQNTIVPLIGERPEWYEIPYQGHSAFVSRSYVERVEQIPALGGRILPPLLNVRDDPGIAGQILGTMSQDSVIDILNEQGEWLEVAFNERTGYVHRDYVECFEQTSPSHGRVSAEMLNVRQQPRLGSPIVGTIPEQTRVSISSLVKDWYEIEWDGKSAYVHSRYVETEADAIRETTPVAAPVDLRETEAVEASLAPDQSFPVSGDRYQKQVAKTWNTFGGLLEDLSGSLAIDPGALVAVLCVESGGSGFDPQNDNRMIIRFENHKFWQYWGKEHTTDFHRHFQYGKTESGQRKVWLGHRWRKAIDQDWRSFHGDQVNEWEVFDFARAFDEAAAMLSISMGAPQIMGFHYGKLDYQTVQDMFQQFSIDIRAQIQGLFAFFDDRMITALREQNFIRFARYYNGSGQQEKYGGWIHSHHEAFHNLLNF